MRLLLIEDDEILGEGLRDYLRAEGHVVDWCTRLSQADATRGEPYDVLLIDWQLPDGSGVAWLRNLRSRGDATPALVLTARDSLSDRIEGLDQGADDYLVKPVAPEELAARLRGVARRTAAAPQARLCFGDVEVDLQARAVWRAGARIDLTAREWTVLEALALRAGRIVAKVDLERLVLGMDSDVASNVLEVHISSLRRKLGRDLVETVRGLGYRLEAS
ncbi:response regulator transcription factor [Sphaerotilus mobilis]|uniref:Two-component system OmpR family response regulator n=1 Tax=Sphaerotilus mobilis TaxID=47994 RepID=A0A4Q7LSA2_9BURK|nr:response regulator transcription factor [Sphaerotilus mobilis]RZS56768.1 two-component system OmpR family response regulator [Sphaerotilus mobilis]